MRPAEAPQAAVARPPANGRARARSTRPPPPPRRPRCRSTPGAAQAAAARARSAARWPPPSPAPPRPSRGRGGRRAVASRPSRRAARRVVGPPGTRTSVVRRRTVPARSAATCVGRRSAGAASSRGVADAGEHQQAVHAGPVGALDVGVEPVTDDERAGPRPAARRRLNSAGSGLPTTTSGARRRARCAAPRPASRCRATDRAADGSVRSVLVATHCAPARIASDASARSAQPTSRPVPLHDRDRSAVGRGRPG